MRVIGDDVGRDQGLVLAFEFLEVAVDGGGRDAGGLGEVQGSLGPIGVLVDVAHGEGQGRVGAAEAGLDQVAIVGHRDTGAEASTLAVPP